MILKRSFPRPTDIAFFLQLHRRRTFDRAPVVKNTRNMSDLLRRNRVGHSQREIPILRALEAYAETARSAHGGGAINGEVREVVLAEQEVRIPIRFEVGIETSSALIDLVLVGVNH